MANGSADCDTHCPRYGLNVLGMLRDNIRGVVSGGTRFADWHDGSTNSGRAA
jgi:hypothetical protein